MGRRRYQQQHHSFTEDVRRPGRGGGPSTWCSRPRRSPGRITYRGLCVTNANPNAYADHLPSHVCFWTYSDASSNRHTSPYSYSCPHGGGSAHGDSRADPYTHHYAYSYTNTYPYADTNADTNAYSYSNPSPMEWRP